MNKINKLYQSTYIINYMKKVLFYIIMNCIVIKTLYQWNSEVGFFKKFPCYQNEWVGGYWVMELVR